MTPQDYFKSHSFYTKGLIKGISHRMLHQKYHNKEFLEAAKKILNQKMDLHHIFEGHFKCDLMLFEIDHDEHLSKKFKYDKEKFPDHRLVSEALQNYFYVLGINLGRTPKQALESAKIDLENMLEVMVRDLDEFVDVLKMMFIENNTDRMGMYTKK